MRKQEPHPRTAIMHHKQKNQSKKARLEALRWLAATFPKAFDNRVQIRPLAVGIMTDILLHAEDAAAVGISKSKLREAVVVFTRRIDYLTALKSREMRIDLQGNPVSPVTEEEAERAAAKIKKRVEKSAKNARKNLGNKFSKPFSQPSYPVEQELAAYRAERDYPLGYQNTTSQPTKAATVVIKHKSSRQYDPDAVARLKEKLGLSSKKETIE